MRTMRWGAAGGLALLLAGAGGLALAPEPIAAQEETVRQECRCVAPDGREVERCTCLRMPDIEGILAQAMPFRGGRIRLGIMVDGSPESGAQGARVGGVMDDGPAAEAGIREGDVITRLDGRSLLEPLGEDVEEGFDLDESIPAQRLLALAAEFEPGEEIEVGILRDGQALVLRLETRDLDAAWGRAFALPQLDADRMRDLGERMRELRIMGPEGRAFVWTDSAHAPRVLFRDREGGNEFAFGPEGMGRRAWPCPGESGPARGFLAFSDDCIGGLELVEVKPGLATYFGTDTGVLVTDVHEDSTLGLQPGDVILAIDGREVADPQQARRVLRSYEGDEEMTLRIMRRNSEMSVQGRLGG